MTAHEIIAAIAKDPIVVLGFSLSAVTQEDWVRSIIAIVVIACVVAQALLGQVIDDWLKTLAMVMIGYYFGRYTSHVESSAKVILGKNIPTSNA
jgi:hypothetical protein